MGAKNLNENAEDNSHLKLMKNNGGVDKLIINTVIPKFTYKNKKGKIVNPNNVSF